MSTKTPFRVDIFSFLPLCQQLEDLSKNALQIWVQAPCDSFQFLSLKVEAKRIVEVATGVIDDGWIGQVHDHGPGGAHMFAFLCWQR